MRNTIFLFAGLFLHMFAVAQDSDTNPTETSFNIVMGPNASYSFGTEAIVPGGDWGVELDYYWWSGNTGITVGLNYNLLNTSLFKGFHSPANITNVQSLETMFMLNFSAPSTNNNLRCGVGFSHGLVLKETINGNPGLNYNLLILNGRLEYRIPVDGKLNLAIGIRESFFKLTDQNYKDMLVSSFYLKIGIKG